jgi:hypothetical protein
MYLDGNARMSRRVVLSDALEILKAGRDPDREDELEEALIGIIESTLDVAEMRREQGLAICRCAQCDAAVRLAQAVIKEFEE